MSHWNADLYDSKHAFVSEYGLDLIDLLEPKAREHILDLGCGTGTLTHEISKSGADVLGLDSSPQMIEKAKVTFSDLEFTVGDGQNFHFPQKFDAIFSNAALHWMTEPKKTISCVWESLKRGGRFVAEFGGKDNVDVILHSISEALRSNEKDVQKGYFFPSLAEYSTLLEAQGFRVTHAFHFDRMTPLEGEEGLKNWVRMFRGFVLEGLSEKDQNELLSRIEERARNRLYKERTWYADYKRLRIRAVKP